MTESFVFTLFIVGSIKMVLGRSRPYTEKDSTDFELFAFSKNRALRSMPSGHTSSAFAIMTVIAKQYNYWWIQIPTYSFAMGVGFQRIEDRQHWTSDVLVGGVIGYFIASALVKKHAGTNSSRLSFKAFVLANRIGVSFPF
jgi:membrane-associated phospholipid phosphatase